MVWFKNPAVWFLSLVIGVFGVWLTGVIHEFLPSPQRTRLAINNIMKGNPSAYDDHFRFVLCWLADDHDGANTRIVEQAFTDIGGIDLVRSAVVVEGTGGRPRWRKEMRLRARDILEAWEADLAIVGFVNESREALSLWFVPRVGDGTLSQTEPLYELQNAILGSDFHNSLHSQIATQALVAALSEANNYEPRTGVLENALESLADKINKLIQAIQSEDIKNHSALHTGLLHTAMGTALAALAKQEGDRKRLKEAIVAYNVALEQYTRDRDALPWAVTQLSLCNALLKLGDQEGDVKHIKEAIAACNAALEEYVREEMSLGQATTQISLGNALRTLGKREGDAKRLHEAIAAYNAALHMHTFEEASLDWATAQNNLGNALTALGELKEDAKHLYEAIAVYNAALEVPALKETPRAWATTQNSLGNALAILGVQEKDMSHLEEAIAAHSKALVVRTRERAPWVWATTQRDLGSALMILGVQEEDMSRLEEAFAAYGMALEVFCERSPKYCKETQHEVGSSLDQ